MTSSRHHNFTPIFLHQVVLQNSIEASASSEKSGSVDLADFSTIPAICVANVAYQSSNTSLTWDKMDDDSVLKYKVGTHGLEGYIIPIRNS